MSWQEKGMTGPHKLGYSYFTGPVESLNNKIHIILISYLLYI